MKRRPLAAVAVLWCSAVATLLALADVRVTPLVTDGRVLASFAAPEAFADDARDVLHSGLLLTFTYAVELRRPATLWFDTTLTRVTVAASGKFDTLTGTYQVTKHRDGRVVWSESTQDETQVRAWMTEFDQIPLEPGGALEPNAEYYVRVRLHSSPRSRFSFWPWGRDDGSGRSAFTFIR